MGTFSHMLTHDGHGAPTSLKVRRGQSSSRRSRVAGENGTGRSGLNGRRNGHARTDRTRQRILRTATHLFAKVGFAAATTEHIARVARAIEVIQNAADNGCLVPVTEAAKANTGRKLRRVLADAGYRSEDGFQKLAEKKIEAFVALRRRKRKAAAEPPFGWIDHVLGFRRFSLRGLRKVQMEWQLVCTALNLKRIATLTTA